MNHLIPSARQILSFCSKQTKSIDGKGKRARGTQLSELVYCLLSHTASKKREDEEHAGWGPLGQYEDDLDLLAAHGVSLLGYLLPCA